MSLKEDGRIEITATRVEHGNRDKWPEKLHGVELRPRSIRCRDCGFRVRGPGHTEGDHHNGRRPRHATTN